MEWCVRTLCPVFWHFMVSEFVAMAAENVSDASLRTVMSALIALPLLLWMYRQDLRKRRPEPVFRGKKMGMEKAGQCHSRYVRNRICIAAAAAASFLGGGVLNFIWSGILVLLSIQEYFSNETQEALLSGSPAVLLSGLCFLVPVTEELVFRGLVCGRMKERLGAGQSVFLSAALFALYHGNPIQMIYAFPMALLLALLYEKSGSIAFPVLFHMGANMAAVIPVLSRNGGA